MERSINSDNINWNKIIKKDVRGINDIYLGRVVGVSEPFIITKKGIIFKQQFYIPKKLLEGYDDIVVYCRISEKEARNNFMRNLQPLYDDYCSNYKAVDLNEESELRYNIIEKNTRNNTYIYYKAELIKKIKRKSNELTEIIQSVVRTTGQKIKEAHIVMEKIEAKNLEIIGKEIFNKIKRLLFAGFEVAENLFKMSQFVMQFTSSFEDKLSKIRRWTFRNNKAYSVSQNDQPVE
jgi:hypothetical protein